jgi:hypothetical protein
MSYGDENLEHPPDGYLLSTVFFAAGLPEVADRCPWLAQFRCTGTDAFPSMLCTAQDKVACGV